MPCFCGWIYVWCEWRINRQPSSTLLLRYIAFQYPSSTPLYLNECVKQFEGAKVGDHISTFMFKWLLRFNYHHPFLLWIAGMFYCNATFSWGLLFPGSHPGFPSSSTSTFGTGMQCDRLANGKRKTWRRLCLLGSFWRFYSLRRRWLGLKLEGVTGMMMMMMNCLIIMAHDRQGREWIKLNHVASFD